MIEAVAAWKNEENLSLICDILEAIKPIPFFGTLLGLTRSGTAIEHDDDVDFWVHKSDRDTVIGLLKSTPFEIDLSLDHNRSEYFLQASRVIDNTKTYVDFYFYEFDANGESCVDRWNWTGHWSIPENHLHVPKSLIFPTLPSKIFGTTVQMPADPQALCEYLYGEKWQTPMKKGQEYTMTVKDHRPFVIERLPDEQMALFNVRKQSRDALQQIENRILLLSDEIEELTKLRAQIQTQMLGVEQLHPDDLGSNSP